MAVPLPAARFMPSLVSAQNALHRHLGVGGGDLAARGIDGPEHLADAVDADGQHQEVDAMQEAGEMSKNTSRGAPEISSITDGGETPGR